MPDTAAQHRPFQLNTHIIEALDTLAHRGLIAPDLDGRARRLAPSARDEMRALFAEVRARGPGDPESYKAAVRIRRVTEGTPFGHEGECLANWTGALHEIARPEHEEALERCRKTGNSMEERERDRATWWATRQHVLECSDKVSRIAKEVLEALDAAELAATSGIEDEMPGSKLAGLLSPSALAELHDLDLDLVKKRLERWRGSHLDGGWIEVADRKPHEPKYLYPPAAVAAVLAAAKRGN